MISCLLFNRFNNVTTLSYRSLIEMEQITIIAKTQIATSDMDKTLLGKTMSVYRDSCNMFQTIYFILMT